MSRAIALILVVVFLPLILLVSILILLEDGFPVFFVQKRVGQYNKLFNIYKFRTMKKNTPDVATHLLQNPKMYLLRTGGFFRKVSLDELPNLLNIIKGELNFIGPRPALYNQDDLIALRKHAGIDSLKPGITGWAQVNGRDEITIEEKVHFEKEYLEKASFWMDAKIIWITIKIIFKRSGVVH